MQSKQNEGKHPWVGSFSLWVILFADEVQTIDMEMENDTVLVTSFTECSKEIV